MLSSGAQSADFIKILHPTLEKAGLSNVSIACCDATGWSAQSTMTNALKQAGVEDLLGVITSHTYTSGINGPQPTKLKAWETEISDLNGRWSTAWYSGGGSGDGFTWANNIYTGLTVGNLSACKSLITLPSYSDTTTRPDKKKTKREERGPSRTT